MDWKDFFFLKNKILKIKPLRDNLTSLSLTDDFCVKEQINHSFGQPHLIKRLRQYFSNSNFNYFDNFKLQRRHVRSTQEKLVIKLAVFFDVAAYHKFVHFLDNSEKQLRNMILAYVNRIQAAFHHPTFGVPLNILLVRLDIMEKQPPDLPLVEGKMSELLYSYCKYANNLNSIDDNDPHHWNIGLYITGIDLYEIEDGQKVDYLSYGYSNGICSTYYSCAIVEFGVKDVTLGFTSSLHAASEIARVLGILDDNDSRCPNYKHIMSTERHFRGQITWSKCSRDVAKELWRTKTCLLDHTNQENHVDALDHTRYHDLPGRKWTAKAQCELYLRDKDANVVTLHDICQILQCEKPNSSVFFYAGPALDGTNCALGKECRGGECMPVLEPPYNFKYCERDQWSEWKKDSCNSSCLEKSKGVIIKQRSCMHRRHRTANCKGPYYAVDLCNDSHLCINNRRTVEDFSTTKCSEFGLIMEKHGKISWIKKEAGGGRANHYDIQLPWIGCIIFCEEKHSFRYFSSDKMLNFGLNPYFPDGTWCHNENGQEYYCRQHYCLPENYSVEE